MIPAKLISGSNAEARQKRAEAIITKQLKLKKIKPHPDLFIFQEENSIKINQIRELKKSLALKPYSAPFKAALILEADKLTLPAQNALLKVLEEPPAQSILILTTNQIGSLLPTLVSRCQIIKLKSPQKSKNHQLKQTSSTAFLELTKNILKGSVGKKLQLITPFSQSREKALEFNQEQILFWQEKLHQKPSLAKAENLRLSLKTNQLLQANINPQLALDQLVFGLKNACD